MQSINKLAVNPPFMVALFAPLLLGGYVVATAFRRPGGTFLLAATGCVLVAVVITVVFHVPHNDTLAAAGTTDPEQTWRDFYPGWQAWNHVRTVAFTAATGQFALALRAD